MDTNNNLNYQSFDKVRLIAERYQTERIFSALKDTLKQAKYDGFNVLRIDVLEEFLTMCEQAVFDTVNEEAAELGIEQDDLDELYKVIANETTPIA